MKKTILTTFILLIFSLQSFAGLCQMIIIPDDPTPEPEPSEELPANNSGTGPANTVTGIGNIIGGFTNPGGIPGGGGATGFGNNPDGSGDFGLTNLRLNGGLTLTSFDDSNDSVGSSGHFREYNLSLTGDLTENDTVSFSLSNTRYETGGTNGILARTNGFSTSWIHHLNDNYGIGAFALLNSVDIEEINGNSYSYAYGLLFTTFHAFENFDLSTATAIAHTDFDTGYDQLLMTSVTFSKQLNDKFRPYLTLTFTDSFKSDPETDPTYGSWEIGGSYIVNDHLSISLGFVRTEFLNNYSDNTLLLNVGWHF